MNLAEGCCFRQQRLFTYRLQQWRSGPGQHASCGAKSFSICFGFPKIIFGILTFSQIIPGHVMCRVFFLLSFCPKASGPKWWNKHCWCNDISAILCTLLWAQVSWWRSHGKGTAAETRKTKTRSVLEHWGISTDFGFTTFFRGRDQLGFNSQHYGHSA